MVYDAEHFFDGCRDDPDYALALPARRRAAGAETVVLCDTNGSSLPHAGQRGDGATVAAQLGDGAAVGIHCHNDVECGVANTLAAVRGRRHAGRRAR